MSGGFFRGTSADQDTRFSNKQAKLLKSQKFAPELDHLVDMSKVQMDVIKPWIATRATELLGFEDEVLINFVYGLLDGKEVDGKQIQIQLTGFMEKNTGKFMRELWSLLLSAQNNASGVPQQFLDAKEEETRKKKAESDRITQEIQKKKEREELELEQEKQIRMDGEVDASRHVKAASDAAQKQSVARSIRVDAEEVREFDGRNDSRRKSRDRQNSRSVSTSPSPQRHSPSQGRRYRSSPRHSVSPRRKHSPRIPRSPLRRRLPHLRQRSTSRSRHRSPSPLRHRSLRGQQRSPSPLRRRSPSPPPRRRSPSPPPRRRSPSPPPRRRSPSSPPRRRSPSPPRRRSPSPPRRRSPSPLRRQSPSPLHRRSLSPLHRRSPSPLRRRSPPLRRRSPLPLRRRSPSPLIRRSPLHRRSPVKVRQRSPTPSRHSSPSSRRRSRSPLRHRSSSASRRSPLPGSPKHLRRSPLYSPSKRSTDAQNSPRRRYRNHSPYRSQSPSFRNHRSLSKDRDKRANGVESKRILDDYSSERAPGKRYPVHHSSLRDMAEKPDLRLKEAGSLSPAPATSLGFPHYDSREQIDVRNRVSVLSVPPEKSPVRSNSLSRTRSRNRNENGPLSSSESPVRQSRKLLAGRSNKEASRKEEERSYPRVSSQLRVNSSHKESDHLPTSGGHPKTYKNDPDLGEYSPERLPVNQSAGDRSYLVNMDSRKSHGQRSDMELSERHTREPSHSSSEVEYGPGRVDEENLPVHKIHIEQSFSRKPAKAASLDERPSKERVSLKSSYSREDYRDNDKKRPHSKDDGNDSPRHKTYYAPKTTKHLDKNDQTATIDSDSEENGTYRSDNIDEKRANKHEHQKKSLEDEVGYDSQIDDRKDVKRRRKDEKKLRKEEKRRRREERHRRREERRAGKHKAKCMVTVTPPPDYEDNYNAADDSDGDAGMRRGLHPSDPEETESEQKKLEIELRKKALESLRAKKATS